MVVEAGLRRPVVGAEAQHDANFVRQDPIEAARDPQDDDRDQDDCDTGAGAEAAGKDPPEAILAAAQDLFEIGRLRAAWAAAAAAGAPGSAATAAGTATAGTAAAARAGAPRSAAVTVPDHASNPSAAASAPQRTAAEPLG
jgi:hypothetical protein